MADESIKERGMKAGKFLAKSAVVTLAGIGTLNLASRLASKTKIQIDDRVLEELGFEVD